MPKNKSLGLLLTGGLFIIYFVCFVIFNRYHILYLEQNQLFRFSFDYFKEHLSLPGGLSQYSGSFFTQFFISPLAGAFILTFYAFTVFIISDYILRRHNFKSTFLAFIPVWLLAILQGNELFQFGQSMGFLLLAGFFALYISIDKPGVRYGSFLAGWPFLYLLAGGFSMPAILMCVLHEMLFRKQKHFSIMSVLFILTGVVVPLLASRLIFYIDPAKVFTYPIISELQSFSFYSLIFLISIFPIFLVSIFLLKKARFINKEIFFGKHVRYSSLIITAVLMFLVVFKNGHHEEAEIMLGMDHHIQKGEWEKVLKLSAKYPGYNRLVIYYTNIALYKTGNLGNKMFSYPQAGSDGLKLKWNRNSSSFFGGEIFYQLGYTNEANRWAFEAMVVKGLNPRSLKKLVLTAIINGDTTLARKYLHQLDQTLFYNNWARHYSSYLTNKDISDVNEIEENRDLLINSDFFSNEYHLNLFDLLANHPENKMAYEYLLASLLLEKNLEEFVRVVSVLKDYGYSKIPVNYEEALVFYNFSAKRNVVPEGFTIRPETKNRFRNYLNTYTTQGSNIVNELKNKYGDTYWYYLQFINNKQ